MISLKKPKIQMGDSLFFYFYTKIEKIDRFIHSSCPTFLTLRRGGPFEIQTTQKKFFYQDMM